MAQVLFWLGVVSEVGVLLLPVIAHNKGSALFGWLGNFFGAGVFTYARYDRYPSWAEPQWHNSNAWALIAWSLFIIGFIVAIRKPWKRNIHVA
jgi:hypothetical protein